MARWAPRGRGGDARTSWSDARPSDDDGPRRVSAEERDRRRRVRARLVAMLFALVFLAGSAAALFAEGGYLDRRDAERVLRAEQEDLFDRALRIRRLRAEIAALEAGSRSLERIAREDLNYVREGEITFLLLEDDRLDPDAGPGRP